MKKMLIITGPQGSGNHLFSKLLALDSRVYGWQDLVAVEWIAHDREPFAPYWDDPESLKDFNWSQSDYYVTSISCPYAHSGQVAVPKYSEFIEQLKALNIQVQVAVIGRDVNILQYQQQRVRDQVTLPEFKKQLVELEQFDPDFISQELVYLYRGSYLKSLSRQLDFPIDYNNPLVNEILKNDANAKYFAAVAIQPLDHTVRRVSGLPPK